MKTKKSKLIKTLKIISMIIILIGVAWNVIHFIPSKKIVSSNPWMKTDRTLISAHRGGASENPENTEKAFDSAIFDKHYIDIIEIDIHTTKDGEYVIHHDETINRMALEENEEPVAIAETNYSDLLNYNLGRNFEIENNVKPYKDLSIEEAKTEGLTIMTLEQFLTKYNGYRDFKLLLELKDKGGKANLAADKVHELFLKEEYAWWKNRTMIISFTDTVIDYIIDNYPDQYVAPLGYKIAPQLIAQTLGLDSLVSPKYHCLQTRMSNSAGPITINCATKAMVEGAHKRNQAITYWTIDNENDMQKLIDINADIITTNEPTKLAKLLNLI